MQPVRLNEISAYQDVSPSDFNAALDKYEKQIVESYHGGLLYRGQRATSNVILADGGKMQRKSANTKNYFTLITEVLPSWEGYPKRAKSFICTNSLNTAHAYGRSGGVYIVVPLENQPIGVASEGDIWLSFQKGFERAGFQMIRYVSDFNDLLARFAKIFRVQLPEDTSEKLIQTLNQIEPKAKTGDHDWEWTETIPDEELVDELKVLLKGFEVNYLKFFNDIFDPEYNDFKLIKSNQIKSIGEHHEFWLSGKVLMVEKNLFDAHIDVLKEQGKIK